MFNTLQSQIICKLLLAYPSYGSTLLQILYENAYSNQDICQHYILSRINPSDKKMSNLNEIRFAVHLLQTVETCSKHCKLQCFGSVLAVSKAGGGSWGGGGDHIYIYIFTHIRTFMHTSCPLNVVKHKPLDQMEVVQKNHKVKDSKGKPKGNQVKKHVALAPRSLRPRRLEALRTLPQPPRGSDRLVQQRGLQGQLTLQPQQRVFHLERCSALFLLVA